MGILRHSRMLGFLHLLGRCERGTLMVEFAMIVPVLTLLLVGGIEIGRFVLVEQKMSRAAVTLADLVAQSPALAAGDFDNLFQAAGDVTGPFEFETRGRVIVSSVSASGGAPATVDWQQAGGGALIASSQIGLPGNPAILPSEMIVRNGENLIVAEVFFDYDAFFADPYITDQILYRRAFFRPRLSDLSVLAP